MAADTNRNAASPVRLSDRLGAAAGMVTPGYRLCDVGCDHAHIPIALLGAGIIPGALGMDVIPGPLEKARENLDLYGEDRVQLRMSDGLDAYRRDDKKYTVKFDGDDQLSRLNDGITELANENRQFRSRIKTLGRK